MEENKESQPNITELLSDLMDARKISIDALSHATNIPSRFIVSLLKAEFDKLPAQPYIRGYLFKIANKLEIDPIILWQSYIRTVEVPVSGKFDSLPSNRFAIKKINTSRLILIITIFAIIAFFGIRLNSIIGNPTINVSIPDSTNEELITITGSVRPGDSLTLNNEVIYPDENGNFIKEVRLELGINTFEFHVERYLGKKQSFIRQVFYQKK